MGAFLSRRWVHIVLLLTLLGGAIFLRIADPSGIKRLRYVTFDYFNRLAPRLPATGVIIVDIDEDSLKKIGQWPWPRTILAELARVIHGMNARSIAFDMVFAEPDRTSPGLIAKTLPDDPALGDVRRKLAALPNNDTVFAKAVGEIGSIVTGFVLAQQKTDMVPQAPAKFLNTGVKPDPLKFVKTSSDFAVTLPEITAVAAGNGSFTAPPDSDGVIRRVPLLMAYQAQDGHKTLLPALSLEALRVAEGKQIYSVKSYGQETTEGHGIVEVALGNHKIPTDPEGNFWVYYAGHRPELYVPAWKVLSHATDPALFANKIVLVGTSTIGLLDLRSSPLNPVVPGVEIHAEIIEQILTGKFMQRPGFFDGAELVAAAAVCLLIVLFSPFISVSTLAFTCFCLILGGFGGAFGAYRHLGLLIDPIYPSMMVLVIFIVASMLLNLRTEAEKKQVRGAFGQYLSPVLIEELTKNPDKLKLGGEVRELSVMFSDVRNFTSISETMDPAELIRMMNDLLTPMTTKIMDFRGTVDKYMGDAIMAFWNAPLDDTDHARNACRAALAMQDVLGPLNDELRLRAEKQGRVFQPLRTGMGIATGPCSVGNMGSRQRFAYSALGDTVNLASRLEGQTKIYGVSSLLSTATVRAAQGFAFLEIDLLAVKGRNEPERVFTLIGDEAAAVGGQFKALKARHDEMLAAYRAQKFDMAAGLVGECLATEAGRPLSATYAFYRERIAGLKSNPPGPNWAGVWVATGK